MKNQKGAFGKCRNILWQKSVRQQRLKKLSQMLVIQQSFTGTINLETEKEFTSLNNSTF